MATRSGEDHLIRRLENVHLGGRPVFVKILADIRGSHIRWKYKEIFSAVVEDAKGLRMERHPEVRSHAAAHRQAALSDAQEKTAGGRKPLRSCDPVLISRRDPVSRLFTATA